jgi:RsiW-degrading membrane proteinase PrsW (M82 family)
MKTRTLLASVRKLLPQGNDSIRPWWFWFFLIAISYPAIGSGLLPQFGPLTGAVSGFPVVLALGSGILYLFLASRFFLAGTGRPLGWGLPALVVCCFPGYWLVSEASEIIWTKITWFIPVTSQVQEDFFSMLMRMQQMAEQRQIPDFTPQQFDHGVLPRAVVLIFAVGFSEELGKWLCSFARRTSSRRERCGLAFLAGVGFGVAEGLIYSANKYNGQADLSIYVVRFGSLVLLHGMLSAVTADLLFDLRRSGDLWADAGKFLLRLAPTALVHGLYDLAVTYDRNIPAWLLLMIVLNRFWAVCLGKPCRVFGTRSAWRGLLPTGEVGDLPPPQRIP